MRNSTLVIALATLTAVGLTPGAFAHSATGTYTLAATPFVSVVCSPNCLIANGGVNLGGYTFAANGELPVHASIADDSGGVVSYTVCQDTNADGLCGNTDPTVSAPEPTVFGCGTEADLALSAVPFDTITETSVFVTTADALSCPEGSATSGTITLTFAS